MKRRGENIVTDAAAARCVRVVASSRSAVDFQCPDRVFSPRDGSLVGVGMKYSRE